MAKVVAMLESVSRVRDAKANASLAQAIGSVFLSLARECRDDSLEATVYRDLREVIDNSTPQFLEIGNRAVTDIGRAERFAKKVEVYELYVGDYSRIIGSDDNVD
jgi:hypothetical protein